MASPARPRTPAKPPAALVRLLFIDNLRWTMMILVVSMHAADTYSPLGNWYYTDRSQLSTAGVLTEFKPKGWNPPGVSHRCRHRSRVPAQAESERALAAHRVSEDL